MTPPFPIFLLLVITITTIIIVVHGSPLSNDNNNEMKDTKIVGGKPVPFDQFSWELSIGLAKKQSASAQERQSQTPLVKESAHRCDGVLLTNEWVMTAGHCCVNEHTFVPYEPKDLLVGYQSKDLDQVYDRGRFPVAEIIIQPGHIHGEANSPHDIALLRLATPFPFPSPAPSPAPAPADQSTSNNNNQNSPYACLPLPSNAMIHYEGSLISIGYGNVHALYYNLQGNQVLSGIKPSRYLKEIDVMDITNQANTNLRAQYCQNRPELICITAIQDQDSTCQGDSGGSLIDPQHDNLVIGITSFGDALQRDQDQKTCIGDTAYTRLAFHTAWIKSHVPSVCLK